MRSSPQRHGQGEGVAGEEQRCGEAVGHGAYAYREIRARTVDLLSTEPGVVLRAVVQEHAEIGGGSLKRGLYGAAHAMRITCRTLAAMFYSERRITARAAIRAQWAGLTAAQERAERLRAEIEAFDRLAPIVEQRLIDAATAVDQARVARARARDAASEPVVCGPGEMRAA